MELGDAPPVVGAVPVVVVVGGIPPIIDAPIIAAVAVTAAAPPTMAVITPAAGVVRIVMVVAITAAAPRTIMMTFATLGLGCFVAITAAAPRIAVMTLATLGLRCFAEITFGLLAAFLGFVRLAVLRGAAAAAVAGGRMPPIPIDIIVIMVVVVGFVGVPIIVMRRERWFPRTVPRRVPSLLVPPVVVVVATLAAATVAAATFRRYPAGMMAVVPGAIVLAAPTVVTVMRTAAPAACLGALGTFGAFRILAAQVTTPAVVSLVLPSHGAVRRGRPVEAPVGLLAVTTTLSVGAVAPGVGDVTVDGVQGDQRREEFRCISHGALSFSPRLGLLLPIATGNRLE